MTLLATLRHAETDWSREGRIQGRTDVPLSDAPLLGDDSTGVAGATTAAWTLKLQLLARFGQLVLLSTPALKHEATSHT